MRISKIEFENFRNFKGYGEIKCKETHSSKGGGQQTTTGT